MSAVAFIPLFIIFYFFWFLPWLEKQGRKHCGFCGSNFKPTKYLRHTCPNCGKFVK